MGRAPVRAAPVRAGQAAGARRLAASTAQPFAAQRCGLRDACFAAPRSAGPAAALRPVFNLTGTVLHTNLGRAVMAPEAIEAVGGGDARPTNLEYDLASGSAATATTTSRPAARAHRRRGRHRRQQQRRRRAAGAGRAGRRKEVLVSRGELIEIGGAFRIPDIMRRAGCKLVEVGTTNRTHLRDFEAIGPRTGAGDEGARQQLRDPGLHRQRAGGRAGGAVPRRAACPSSSDLGSGTLVDLTRWGLPAEPTPAQSHRRRRRPRHLQRRQAARRPAGRPDRRRQGADRRRSRSTR
jgi:L-seryl-tRNA(Ser) seleniumtransferase